MKRCLQFLKDETQITKIIFSLLQPLATENENDQEKVCALET